MSGTDSTIDLRNSTAKPVTTTSTNGWISTSNNARRPLVAGSLVAHCDTSTRIAAGPGGVEDYWIEGGEFFREDASLPAGTITNTSAYYVTADIGSLDVYRDDATCDVGCPPP